MPEKRYRVLLVSSHPVQYASPLFRRMEQHPNLDITVAFCSLQGAEAGIDPDFGVEVQWDIPLLNGFRWVLIPNKSLRPGLGRFFGLFNPGLWTLVNQAEFDAVVVYTGYMCASFWIVAAAAKLRKIALLFGTDATSLAPRSYNRLKVEVKRKVLPHIFRMATVALAPSTATADYLRSLCVREDRIVTIPFVVDNDFWTIRAAEVNRKQVRATWGVGETEPVVLFCAKLQPWKRPQDALKAFAQANIQNARLIMAGEGPMRAALEAEARQLKIADRVKFLGFVNQSQLPALYTSADVMVLPSEYDPCPVVVCEAMLCGCPVILSDKIRGRFELVQPGETGFIYPCRDVQALGKVLRGALLDINTLGQIGRAAANRMETWSPREHIQSLLQAIKLAVRVQARSSPDRGGIVTQNGAN